MSRLSPRQGIVPSCCKPSAGHLPKSRAQFITSRYMVALVEVSYPRHIRFRAVPPLRAPGLTRPAPRQPERRPCSKEYCGVGTGRTLSNLAGTIAPHFLARAVARVRSCGFASVLFHLSPPWSPRRRTPRPSPKTAPIPQVTTLAATTAWADPTARTSLKSSAPVRRVTKAPATTG